MDEKSTVTLRIPKKVAITVLITIVLVAILVAIWQVYPLLNRIQLNNNFVSLPPMNLTLVSLNGTSITLNESTIAQLQSFESKGGFKTSAGSICAIS